MKDCKEVLERLSAFIDNELPPMECERIERHLRNCRPCAKEEESLRKINYLLDSMPDEKPAPTFTSMAVHRAVAWMRCEYVKEYIYRYAVAALSLLLNAERDAVIKRRYPVYGHLSNFDDFPPESLSGFYVSLIEDGK